MSAGIGCGSPSRTASRPSSPMPRATSRRSARSVRADDTSDDDPQCRRTSSSASRTSAKRTTRDRRVLPTRMAMACLERLRGGPLSRAGPNRRSRRARLAFRELIRLLSGSFRSPTVSLRPCPKAAARRSRRRSLRNQAPPANWPRRSARAARPLLRPPAGRRPSRLVRRRAALSLRRADPRRAARLAHRRGSSRRWSDGRDGRSRCSSRTRRRRARSRRWFQYTSSTVAERTIRLATSLYRTRRRGRWTRSDQLRTEMDPIARPLPCASDMRPVVTKPIGRVSGGSCGVQRGLARRARTVGPSSLSSSAVAAS